MAIHSTASGAPATSNVVDFAAARTLLRPVGPLAEMKTGCKAAVTPTEIPTTEPPANIVDLAAFRSERYPLDPLKEAVRSAEEQLKRLDSYGPLLSGA